VINSNDVPLNDLIVPGSPTAKRIFRYARSKGLQHHDADDIAQETALRCLSYFGKRPHLSRVEGTVISIAKKCVVNEYRRRNEKRAAMTSYPHLNDIAKPESCERFDTPTLGDIERQLRRINARTKEIVVRRLIYRESVADIAENLQMAESAVRSRLYRLRKAFALRSPTNPVILATK